MAVTQGKSPIIFTAVADSVSYPVWIDTIRAVTGPANSGKVRVLDRASGRLIWVSRALDANDADESPVIDGRYDGIYIEQLPTGGEVHVYYK